MPQPGNGLSKRDTTEGTYEKSNSSLSGCSAAHPRAAQPIEAWAEPYAPEIPSAKSRATHADAVFDRLRGGCRGVGQGR
jgi:hypothetical protein